MKHERIFRYVFLCLFFAFPLSSYITDFLHINSGVLSIVARAVQAIAAIWYMIFLLRHKLFRVGGIQFALFLFFWFLYIIRIIHDTTLYGNQLGFPSYQYYLFGIVLSFLCAFPVFSEAPIDETKLSRQVLLVSLSLTILALYNTVSSGEMFIVRMGGNERLNPITTSLVATMPVLISLREMFFSRNNSLLKLLFYLACMTISVITLLVVSTKVMFICIGFGLLLMLLHMLRQKRVGALAVVFIFFAAIVLFVIYGGYTEYFALTLIRFTDVAQDQSSQERIDLLHDAIKQIKESPILGSFIEVKIQKFYPHNLVVESFMTTGIVGGVLFLFFYGIFCLQTVTTAFKTEFGVVSIIAIAYCLMALTSSSLSFSAENWYIAAVVSWMATAKWQHPVDLDPSFKGHEYNLQLNNE